MKTRKIGNNKLTTAAEANIMRLRLLAFVNGFQKNVVLIKKKFEIPAMGFPPPPDISILDWIKHHQAYFDPFENDVEENKFKAEIFKLGIKYKLPYNLFYYIMEGLPYYILTGRFIVPKQNWEWQFSDIESTEHDPLWMDIKIYSPLSKEEKIELKEALKQAETIMPKEILAKKNISKKFDRDMKIIEFFKNQPIGKPKLMKRYVQGSYLEILSRSSGISPEKISKIEKTNKKSIYFDFNKPTSRNIGESIKASPGAVRQAKKRLNSLAKKMFGISLEL